MSVAISCEDSSFSESHNIEQLIDNNHHSGSFRVRTSTAHYQAAPVLAEPTNFADCRHQPFLHFTLVLILISQKKTIGPVDAKCGLLWHHDPRAHTSILLNIVSSQEGWIASSARKQLYLRKKPILVYQPEYCFARSRIFIGEGQQVSSHQEMQTNKDEHVHLDLQRSAPPARLHITNTRCKRRSKTTNDACISHWCVVLLTTFCNIISHMIRAGGDGERPAVGRVYSQRRNQILWQVNSKNRPSRAHSTASLTACTLCVQALALPRIIAETLLPS